MSARYSDPVDVDGWGVVVCRDCSSPILPAFLVLRDVEAHDALHAGANAERAGITRRPTIDDVAPGEFDVFSIPCPRCGVGIGEPCVTTGGNPASAHAGRARFVVVPAMTDARRFDVFDVATGAFASERLHEREAAGVAGWLNDHDAPRESIVGDRVYRRVTGSFVRAWLSGYAAQSAWGRIVEVVGVHTDDTVDVVLDHDGEQDLRAWVQDRIDAGDADDDGRAVLARLDAERDRYWTENYGAPLGEYGRQR